MKVPLTLRLTQEATDIITAESNEQGITRTSVVELALRAYAKLRAKAKKK